ncbi:MAG: hypothetical protein M0P95_17985 [Sulfuritalea sp.]|jgi:hypothetical protein|nr:hypothetical protein [Sulfuritalea sp.]
MNNSTNTASAVVTGAKIAEQARTYGKLTESVRINLAAGPAGLAQIEDAATRLSKREDDKPALAVLRATVSRMAKAIGLKASTKAADGATPASVTLEPVKPKTPAPAAKNVTGNVAVDKALAVVLANIGNEAVLKAIRKALAA